MKTYPEQTQEDGRGHVPLDVEEVPKGDEEGAVSYRLFGVLGVPALVEAFIFELLVERTVVVDDTFLGLNIERRVVPDALLYLPLLLLDGVLHPVPVLLLCKGKGRRVSLGLQQGQLLGVACGLAAGAEYTCILSNQFLADDGGGLSLLLARPGMAA
jgi:hypothetical protein